MNIAVQFFEDKAERPCDVLSRLRLHFRAFCISSQPLPKQGEPITDAELSAIFVMCYAAYHDYATPFEVRTKRWMRDLKEYRAAHGGLLPHYVMHTHHRVQTESVEEIAHLRVLWEHYAIVCQMPLAIAEYTKDDIDRTVKVVGEIVKK